MSIEYKISILDAHAHLFRVELTVNIPSEKGHVFSLPNWIPGSYMIRDFSRNIVQIHAKSNQQDIALTKLDKNSWQAAPVQGVLVVEYDVYAWDLSVRAAHLDASHGFFNGTSVFLSLVGFEEMPVSVEIVEPSKPLHAWKVATSLSAEKINESGYGLYSAKDYDDLIDHPVEMGEFTKVTFSACGVAHEVVITGRFDADLDRLCKDLTVICEHHIRFFGEPAPMSKYVFLVMIVGSGYGGLEHRASTSLLASRKHLPAKGMVDISDDYLEFLGLCSHEYFHTWNVKRIKPAVFVPYQLQSESYTQMMWAFEGITSYYDDLALVRCGLIDTDTYLKLLGKTITRVYRGSGRLKQSVSDSSFDAWSKFYKQDENAPNAIVSYYAKGMLIALALDCELRQLSEGRVNLDHLMAELWSIWKQEERGLGEREIEVIAEKLVGQSMHAFFDNAIRGTKDLPLKECFKFLGITLNWRAAESLADLGGTKKAFDLEPLSIGARYGAHDKGLLISQVFDNGAAQKAGLSAGDIVVAVDGYMASTEGLQSYLKRCASGDGLEVHFFRHEELRVVSLIVQHADLDTCFLEPAQEGAKQRQQWLNIS